MIYSIYSSIMNDLPQISNQMSIKIHLQSWGIPVELSSLVAILFMPIFPKIYMYAPAKSLLTESWQEKWLSLWG